MRPARIGILGAARIAESGIVGPARDTGSRLVAIAARDPQRAASFAGEHGVERVVADYASLVADPEIDLVYNPLPNSMHAEWNLAAIAAGKHVLSEKPFASNADEALRVHEAGRAAGAVVADGFHYRYHPVTRRLVELVQRGALGEVVEVAGVVEIPRPGPDDPRLSLQLAGGSLMDGGCYPLHALGLLGEVLGGAPVLESATAREFADLPGVDESVEARLRYAGGALGIARSWMAGRTTELSLTVRGTRGWARVENFILPHIDDRLSIEIDGVSWTEHHGARPSYSYQLEAVLRAIRHGDALPTDSADAVRTMGGIDAIYRAAGLRPRGLTA